MFNGLYLYVVAAQTDHLLRSAGYFKGYLQYEDSSQVRHCRRISDGLAAISCIPNKVTVQSHAEITSSHVTRDSDCILSLSSQHIQYSTPGLRFDQTSRIST